VDIPEEERKDFYLYVDEFQNFATEAFANILSEARKYRLSLILAHQYINQLIFDGNATVRDAIFGNVGTIVSFRVGAEDAEHLEKEFDPIFVMNDIVNLAKYQIYLKLMIDGIAGDAFSATTLPPVDLSETLGNEENAIKVSRERYGRSRAEIEERIARWSGMFDFEEPKKENSAAQRNYPEASRLSVKPVSQPIRTDNSKTTPIRKEIVKNAVPRNEYTPAAAVREVLSQTDNSPEIFPASVNDAVRPDSTPIVAEEKKMFDAVCSSCEEHIQVPFTPDPKRPTFCRECLKDYQRARARVQQEKQERIQVPNKIVLSQNTNSQAKQSDVPEKKHDSEIVATQSFEKPMKLTQMVHMAPKKFQSARRRPEVDVVGVRDLINKTKNN
jgi:CxxC-x17-CxxC domain-containing protein